MPDKRNRGISRPGLKIGDVLDAPTVTATNVGTARAYNNGAATVTLSQVTGGPATSWSITTTPTTTTTTATSSPATITGLSSATSYTVSVTGTGAAGTSATTTTGSFTATTVPQAPTIGSASVPTGQAYTGTASASVPFTPGATGGSSVTGYTVTSSSGQTGTGASSPITVSGEALGVARTYTVTATNANGTSIASSASNAVTPSSVPQTPTLGTPSITNTTTISLPFTANTGGSSITSATVTSSPSIALSTSGTTSPLTATGTFASGQTYTFTATLTNANGTSGSSAASNSITPNPILGNFESIATSTPSGVNTFTFSSIPGTYTHLQIRFSSVQASGGSLFYVRFNSDTATNYAWHELNGQGSAAAAYSGATQAYIKIFGRNVGTGGSNPTAGVVDILDYANTNKYKTSRSLVGMDANGSGEIDFMSGLWQSTSAITSITIYTHDSVNISSGSTFGLYGIK